ncbi:Oidioi.mRNA.OKI2018_I69.chr2.g4204.t1.cds [Oikopleura dioica]|uniref:Oidioi.mRNA.OKI2018_I69.chr2.g4204.t1.cds n=1 Tax=Oikopleura dioica TaxID=34765 RepID=A0ABN7SX22_OIKDI|nr:Oidioi.mRNA.OKI2018_I69.chr2.g4204.t1.cds [Oikopleura dioica]
MKILVVSFLIAVISGQQTCGLPDTYPCPLEKTFPRDNIYRTYIVKVTIQGDSNLPLEDDRNWQVFNDMNGYNDSSDMRDYTMRYDSNGAGVIITFDLPFAANTFMSRSSNHASLMQNLETPVLVEWLGLDQSFITSALDVQITTPNNCDNVEQPCASLNLSCEEISSSGRMECSSPCDSTMLIETCGTHATCSQKADPINTGQYAAPVCECEGDYWWRSNEEPNSCRPVMQNWLIIVIAVVGFLVIMLIIFLIVYCCVRKCQCPVWCGPCCCCCKREDDRDLVYKVTGEQINHSFQSDEGEKKLPLPDAYSSQTNTVRNPAIWYDMPTDDFGLVRSGQPHGTILTTGKAFIKEKGSKF